MQSCEKVLVLPTRSLVATCVVATCIAAVGAVWNEGAPRITGPKVFGATPGRRFMHPFTTCGNREGLLWSIGGTLPHGVSLDPRTGILSGCIQKSGRWTFIVRATNVLGGAERPFALVVGDGMRALTPPMGWSSWNACSSDVDQRHVEENAAAMVSMGLAAHGYTYVNVDSCWQGRRNDVTKALDADDRVFPNMALMVSRIHGLGLKAGIYSTPMVWAWGGSDTRMLQGGSGYPLDPDHFHPFFGGCGKRGYEVEDARQFARWGFDWLKYDWSMTDLEHTRRMREALDKTERDIVLQVSTSAQFKDAAKYGRYSEVARHGGDTKDEWTFLRTHCFMAADRWLPFIRPGFWVDLDMLAIGPIRQWHNAKLPYACEPLPDDLRNRLTPDEQMAHFAWWAIIPTPLFISCDIPHIDNFTLALVTNTDLIDINQDYPAMPAVPTDFPGQCRLWTRELSDGRTVLGFFNLGEDSWKMERTLDTPRLTRDVLAMKDLGKCSRLSETIPPHACKVYLLEKTANNERTKR